MLTHRWSDDVAGHFERLRTEAAAMLPAFLGFGLSDDAAAPPEGCVPDVVIRPSDAVRLLPTRVAYAERQGIWTGSTDRFAFPALAGPLRRFARVWVVEYDVDFAGDWADLFASICAMPGDYAATHVRSRAADPDWPHWEGFATPMEIAAERQLASFHPVAGFSRRFIDTYLRAVAGGRWLGHTEALYPTLAAAHGLLVVDLGGRGDHVPAGCEGHHYRPPVRPDVLSESFGYRPPVAQRYFHDAPELFADRGLLHHPVKLPDLSGPPDLLMEIGRTENVAKAAEPTAAAENLTEPAPIPDATAPSGPPAAVEPHPVPSFAARIAGGLRRLREILRLG